MAQPRYDLVYFNIRAFAEPIRMLLHHRGLAYRYWMPWDYFGKPWAEAKQDVAFGEVPVLVVDGGTMLWESAAIMRYLAHGTSLMPDDTITRAVADACLDSTKRFVMPVDAVVNMRSGERFEREKTETLAAMPGMLAPFVRQLETSGGPFLTGGSPNYADLTFFHHLDLMLLLDPGLCERFPPLGIFRSAILELDGLAGYLETRPVLTGVGVDPRIELNGVPTSTWEGRV